MAKWKVNDGVQVVVGDKLYGPGDEFSASQAEVDEGGAADNVSEVKAKKESANKAQASSANKARKSSSK
jgi:hypothetical protein